jgi:hypothetical protein
MTWLPPTAQWTIAVTSAAALASDTGSNTSHRAMSTGNLAARAALDQALTPTRTRPNPLR